MIKCEYENGNKALLRHAVVDNIVLKDGKVLLVKRAANLLEGGKWGLVGGFVDRDETVKEAATREIMEETGYTVSDITLLGIIDRPDRKGEDRQNISFVYFSNAVEKIGNADNESEAQAWFGLSELPGEEEFAFDHFYIIKLYADYLRKPFALPKIG